jgi:hypothetical protein
VNDSGGQRSSRRKAILIATGIAVLVIALLLLSTLYIPVFNLVNVIQ